MTKTLAVRGAVTVSENSVSAIEAAALEMMRAVISENALNLEEVSHVIFTMTKDLNAVYPAKCVREKLNFSDIPLLCMQELDIENSLPMCIRVLMVINSDKERTQIKHIYLKDAKKIRPDIN
ncbi:MAG: chorismate mutase [Candidatus Gastranaerophilales bacterium]|nr:chorismate mutase [Candidatus Gastranaerophilales bacterium]